MLRIVPQDDAGLARTASGLHLYDFCGGRRDMPPVGMGDVRLGIFPPSNAVDMCRTAADVAIDVPFTAEHVRGQRAGLHALFVQQAA